MIVFELLLLIILLVVLFRWRDLNRLMRQVGDLTARIQHLEQQIRLLQAPSPPLERPVEQPPALTVAPAAPELESADAWSQLIAEHPTAHRVELAEQVTEAVPIEAAAPPEKPPTPAAKFRRGLSDLWSQKSVDVDDWETVIGGKWLNKIGIVVLVIGVSFFLGYSLRYMGPFGRVGTGLVTSLALLLGGVFLERIEKYTLFAKPLIGGGWALLYFTAYAAHNVEAAKVIQEPIWGLALLGLVAAGMILHSLKYRSQIVTGLAYFLGFLTVAISPLTGFALVASSILAASLVAILRTMRWYPLGLFGLAATYLNHLLWLEYTIGGPTQLVPAGSFWLSQGMLVLYWLLFAGFDFLLKPENDKEEQMSLAINLANTLAFLGLSFRQVGIVFPDARYLLTGLTSVAYIASSYLLRVRERQKLYLINASVVIVLIALTFPLKPPFSLLSQNLLVIAWLVEAVAVLALGLYLKEIVFRVHAYLLSLCALGTLFFINLYGQPEAPDLLRWMTVLPAVAYFYSLFGQLHKGWGRGEVRKEEKDTGILSSYAASAVLALLLWKQLSPELVGLAWLGVALLLVEAGIRFRQSPLRIQGYGLSALALGAFFLVNLYGLYGQQADLGLSRWVIVPPAVLAFYYLFGRLHRMVDQGRVQAEEKQFANLSSYAASALVTVLLWKELDAVTVALAWGFLSLILIEVGIRFQHVSLRFQGYLLSTLAFGRLFMANFTAPGVILGLSYRVVSVIPIIIIFYYLVQRLTEERDAGRTAERETHLPQAYSYAAAVLLVVLARFEFGRSLTVVAWATTALILLALGIFWRDRDFRVQSCLIAILTVWRSWSTNFFLIGSFYGIPERIATTVPVIVSLYASNLLSRYRQGAFRKAEGGQGMYTLERLDAYSRHLFSILASFLLAIFLFYAVQGNLLTVAWTVQGLGLMAAGFLIKDRILRLSGLGLFTVCLFKVFLIDLSGLEMIYRIFSFIVLGIILLIVSFGYTRYKDVITRYI